MSHPFGFSRKVELFCALQRVDGASSQIGRLHVGGGRRIDRIARRPAEQIAQERKPRLAWSRAKDGEALRTKLRGETRLACVPRPGIIDGDVGRSAQPGFEHRVVLGPERLEFGDQQPHDLSLGDRNADGVQQRHDPLAGHLALKMQRQNQAMQMRPAAADYAGRRLGHDHASVRSFPAFAPKAW
jgi:hypothetical protein